MQTQVKHGIKLLWVYTQKKNMNSKLVLRFSEMLKLKVSFSFMNSENKFLTN